MQAFEIARNFGKLSYSLLADQSSAPILLSLLDIDSTQYNRLVLSLSKTIITIHPYPSFFKEILL